MSAWEYREDAQDFIADEELKGRARIYRKASLKQLGVDPDDDTNWESIMRINRESADATIESAIDSILEAAKYTDDAVPIKVQAADLDKIKAFLDQRGIEMQHTSPIKDWGEEIWLTLDKASQALQLQRELQEYQGVKIWIGNTAAADRSNREEIPPY